MVTTAMWFFFLVSRSHAANVRLRSPAPWTLGEADRVHRSWCFQLPSRAGARDPDARARSDPPRCRSRTEDRRPRVTGPPGRAVAVCKRAKSTHGWVAEPSVVHARLVSESRPKPESTRFSSTGITRTRLVHSLPPVSSMGHPAPGRLDLVMTILSALLTAVLLVGSGALPDPGALRGQGVWPLQPLPEVIHGFRAPDSPWGSGHRGVDLAATPGQKVHAALPGRVTYAGPLAGRGVVVVSHGDTRTTYEPVTPTVGVGDLVSAGAGIGRLALSGSHCSPAACLHWGWLAGEIYLDPLDLVGAGRVRLLPLSGLGSVPTAPITPVPPAIAGETPGSRTRTLPVLRALTRAGALVGRPSGAARW